MESDSLRFNKQSTCSPLSGRVCTCSSRSVRRQQVSQVPAQHAMVFFSMFIPGRQKRELSYLKLRRVSGVTSLLMVSNKVILPELTSATPATIRRLWGLTCVQENVNTHLKLHLTSRYPILIAQQREFSALVFNFFFFSCGLRDGPQCYFNLVSSRRGDLLNQVANQETLC